MDDGEVGEKGAVSMSVLMVLLHHIWIEREREREMKSSSYATKLPNIIPITGARPAI